MAGRRKTRKEDHPILDREQLNWQTQFGWRAKVSLGRGEKRNKKENIDTRFAFSPSNSRSFDGSHRKPVDLEAKDGRGSVVCPDYVSLANGDKA